MQNSVRNRGRTWQWIIGFIVVVLLVWGVARLLRDEGEALSGRAVGIPVVAPDPVVPVNPLDPGDVVAAVDTGSSDMIPVAAISATPAAFHGRPLTGVALVADATSGVPAHEGFWIEEADQRIFVVVQDGSPPPQGDATPSDARLAPAVRPGQRVALSGRVYPGTMAPQVATELDADTRSMLSAQPAFLLVEPGNINAAGTDNTNGGSSETAPDAAPDR